MPTPDQRDEISKGPFSGIDHENRTKIERDLRQAVDTMARNMDRAIADSTEHILQFFGYAHLPAHLQAISKPFCELAAAIVYGDNNNQPPGATFPLAPLPRNPERTVALRKLLEAKDAAVRALVAK